MTEGRAPKGGSRRKPAASELLLAAIGATSCLYAVWDVAADVLLRHSSQSDAAALARLTGLPAIVWSVVWAAFSVAVLVGGQIGSVMGLKLFSPKTLRSGTALLVGYAALRLLWQGVTQI